MNIIAIDPGSVNGIAKFNQGELVEVFDLSPIDLFVHLIDNTGWIDMVIIEDSRMISHLYTGENKKRPVALNMARKVGQVDRLCGMIEDFCKQYKKPLISISPKGKGAKMNDERFKAITGWEQRTSQHQRDAVQVGWRYRHVKAVA
jgi:hypothetical protein